MREREGAMERVCFSLRENERGFVHNTCLGCTPDLLEATLYSLTAAFSVPR